MKYANGGYILKDWLGRMYSIGTEVIYPRSSVEIAYGTVTDIYRVCRDERYKWQRIDDTKPWQADSEYRVCIRVTRNSRYNETAKEVTIKNIENITVLGVPTAAARPFAGCVRSE